MFYFILDNMIADLFSVPNPPTRRPELPQNGVNTADVVFGGVPPKRRPVNRPSVGPRPRPSGQKRPLRRPNGNPFFNAPNPPIQQAFTLPSDSLRSLFFCFIANLLTVKKYKEIEFFPQTLISYIFATKRRIPLIFKTMSSTQ